MFEILLMIPKILFPRYFKWVGLVIYLIMFIYGGYYGQIYKLDDVNFSTGLYIQLGIFAGLIMMIYAKLKVEDEMTTQIRMVSLQWAILVFIILRITFKSIAFYYKNSDLLPKYQINSLLLIYLILLYSQVYFIPWVKSK